MEVGAGHEGEELSEVTLFEAAVETSFDQGGHSLKGSCPEIMSLSEQAEIDLELLEQLHQVVEMSRKGKMKDFVFSTVDVHHWHISLNLLCNLRSNELVNSLRIAGLSRESDCSFISEVQSLFFFLCLNSMHDGISELFAFGATVGRVHCASKLEDSVVCELGRSLVLAINLKDQLVLRRLFSDRFSAVLFLEADPTASKIG